MFTMNPCVFNSGLKSLDVVDYVGLQTLPFLTIAGAPFSQCNPMMHSLTSELVAPSSLLQSNGAYHVDKHHTRRHFFIHGGKSLA